MSNTTPTVEDPLPPQDDEAGVNPVPVDSSHTAPEIFDEAGANPSTAEVEDSSSILIGLDADPSPERSESKFNINTCNLNKH